MIWVNSRGIKRSVFYTSVTQLSLNAFLETTGYLEDSTWHRINASDVLRVNMTIFVIA